MSFPSNAPYTPDLRGFIEFLEKEHPEEVVRIKKEVDPKFEIGAIAAVLGFARRYLNHDNAASRYLTTAIFPIYILHQTIIVVVAHALKPVNLPPAVEGPLLILVTATGCLVGYEIIRRSARVSR